MILSENPEIRFAPAPPLQAESGRGAKRNGAGKIPRR
jgi:hypothetical protein